MFSARNLKTMNQIFIREESVVSIEMEEGAESQAKVQVAHMPLRIRISRNDGLALLDNIMQLEEELCNTP